MRISIAKDGNAIRTSTLSIFVAGLAGFGIGAIWISQLANDQRQNLDRKSSLVETQYQVISKLRQRAFALARGRSANAPNPVAAPILVSSFDSASAPTVQESEARTDLEREAKATADAMGKESTRLTKEIGELDARRPSP